MKTRLISVLFLAGILLAFIGEVQAQSSNRASPVSDFSYDLSSRGDGVKITKYTGRGGAVVIPSTIEDMPVIEIGLTAFSANRYHDQPAYNITSIVIPASIKYIGSTAFSFCERLTSVTIQGTGVVIAGRAFYNCTELTSLTFPEGENSIAPEYANADSFLGCQKLPLRVRQQLRNMGFGF